MRGVGSSPDGFNTRSQEEQAGKLALRGFCEDHKDQMEIL